jgi:hypothetical protein
MSDLRKTQSVNLKSSGVKRNLEVKERPATLEKVGCQQLNLAAALSV